MVLVLPLACTAWKLSLFLAAYVFLLACCACCCWPCPSLGCLCCFAVLCCCRCCCARRLPITAADCAVVADYGSRYTRCCAVSVAVACCFLGGSGTQQCAWCHVAFAAGPCARPCARPQCITSICSLLMDGALCGNTARVAQVRET